MSQTFTKLFAGITESTLWCEPDRTRLVWITMLAMADQFGRVWGSVPGLANRARVPLEDARIAIASFMAPDPDSRTKDHEGKRIEEIDGGWRLLNHGKYRELRSADDRREQNRLAQANKRARVAAAKRAGASATVSNSQQSQPRSAQAEAEAEAEKKRKKSASTKKPGFLDDARADLLTDWCAIRKAKRGGPITETVARILRNETAKAGVTLEEAITACIQFGWINFNAGWYAERQQKCVAAQPANPFAGAL